MPFQISKRFDFSASHQLAGLPAGHQCARLHGHNYSVTVYLGGPTLNQIGFIRDYGELDVVKQFIDKNLEHHHLNNIVKFNPTAENLAKWIFEELFPRIPELVSVSVKETDKTEAIYYPEGLDA